MPSSYGVYSTKEVRFAFVGDLHLNSSTPSSRVDDYAETSLEKLETLSETLRGLNIRTILLAGDVFHKNQQSLIYLGKVFETFVKLRELGFEVYTIYGNHDLAFDKTENIDKSPLWLLVQAGLIYPLKTLVLGNGVEVEGTHYPEDICGAGEGNKISLSHRFFESDLSSRSYKEDELISLGYQMYLMGHDHVPYDTYTMGNGVKVVRPGSFMRTTAHGYNLIRDVFVGIVNSEDMSVELIKLKVRPAESVFSSAVINSTELSMKKVNIELQYQIGQLLDKMEGQNGSGGSVYAYLDAMDVGVEVKTRVEEYLIQNNIYRREGK